MVQICVTSGVISPIDLDATAVSQTQIDLSWHDNSSDESSFHIERSADGSTGWTEIGTVAANAITYSDSALVSGTTHYYRARAYRGSDGQYSAYSNVDGATTPVAIIDRHIYLPLMLRVHP